MKSKAEEHFWKRVKIENRKKKRDFISQYVLNRALCHSGGLMGDEAAAEALKAWNKIEEFTKEEDKENGRNDT